MCIITFAMLVGCKKETPLITSPNNVSVESDYIRFSMPNQNVSFSDSLKNTPDSLFAVYYNGVSDSALTGGAKLYALAVAGYRSKDSSEVSLIIEGYSAITTAKYNFVDAASLNNPNGLTQPKFFGLAYTISNRLGYGFIDNVQTTGYTQITNFDLTNKIIEGNFVQNNCAEYDGNNNILAQGFNMTNGTFKTKIQVINQSDYDTKYKSLSIHSSQIPKLSALVNKF